MAEDRFEQLKRKCQSVLNFIQTQSLQLQNLNMEGDKLFIRATAPSQEAKNRVWDQIKLVDPSYSDLIADIQAPAAAAAAAVAGATTTSARTDATKYMKIFEANRDKLASTDQIRPGVELLIP